MNIENLIDAICRDYELALNSGENPDIEIALSMVPGKNRADLTNRLLILKAKAEKNNRSKTKLVDSQPSDSNQEPSPAGSGVLPPVQPVMSGRSGPVRSDADDVTFPSIDKYRFIEKIGEGGFGVVYLAEDRLNKHKRVAVKLVRIRSGSTSGKDSDSNNRNIPELNEAWRMAEMDHDHILRVLDAGKVSDSEIFITTQYIAGPKQSDWMKSVQGRPNLVLPIILGLARALEHAHRQGIFHRDIKPANILLDDSNKPYLMDFGLALHEDDYSMRKTGLTGTVRYMSPEQANGQAMMVDGRSDIFSLGVLFYELLSGKRPFRGYANLEILSQICHVSPIPIRQKIDISPTLEAICMKCLEKRPEDRYQTAGDLARDLEKEMQRHPDIPRHHPDGTNNNQPGLKILSLKTIFPLTLLVSVTCLLFGFSRNEQPPNPLPYPPPNPSPYPPPNPDDLARQTFAIFEAKCKKCHHDKKNGNLDDILDHHKLMTGSSENGERFVTPKDIEKSDVWVKVDGKEPEMPPSKEQNTLSTDEIQTIRQWILAGAPAWPAPSSPKYRESITLVSLHKEILKDLKKLPNQDARKHRRYFSMVHLWNNPEVTDAQLKTTAIAISKAVNSLSWERDIKPPVQAGDQPWLLAINLPDYGWEENNKWNAIIDVDPYRLDFNSQPELQEIISEINETAENFISEPLWVRADWFVHEATRPPLYHTLLDLPDTVDKLENLLSVDANQDFIDAKLKRAGFLKSGVSNQNRVVDRFESQFGYYWKSYDFKPNGLKSNILQFPLGPNFKDNPFSQSAFQADGGEMVFSLKNGLNGYYLATSDGKRLDIAPIDIVEDKRAIANQTPEIINGKSCMVCHDQGIKRFEDDIRKLHNKQGELRAHLEKIIPEKKDWEIQLSSDQQAFLDALKKSVTPFLDAPDLFENDFLKQPEPIGQVAAVYFAAVSLETLKYELYSQDSVDEFRRKVSYKSNLGDRLQVLQQPGGKITRAELEKLDNLKGGKSTYGFIARELNLGTPYSR